MSRAELRFYAELNDFLAADRRGRTFVHEFARRASVKDVIESFGVPHTEIEIILVNGRSVDFSHIVADGDRISVYPMFERLDVTPLLRLRPQPLRNPRFVADVNLGRLARYLRLLGFDCVYRNDLDDGEAAHISSAEHRILLTRDRGLLRRKIITHGYFVRAARPRHQVAEVLERLDLRRLVQPFSRCTRCNGPIRRVAKTEIEAGLEPKTRLYYDEFRRCDDCRQIYWAGSHHARAGRLIEELLRAGSASCAWALS